MRLELKDLQAFIPVFGIFYVFKEAIQDRNNHREDKRTLKVYDINSGNALSRGDIKDAEYWIGQSQDLIYQRLQELCRDRGR